MRGAAAARYWAVPVAMYVAASSLPLCANCPIAAALETVQPIMLRLAAAADLLPPVSQVLLLHAAAKVRY